MNKSLIPTLLFGMCFIPTLPPKPVLPPTPPPVVIVVPPTAVPVPTPIPVPSPTVPPSPHSGNGQIWCSGPSAPGWNVSLPNGGCKNNQCVPITDFRLDNKVKGDGKIELYWKGSGPVTLWKFEKNLLNKSFASGNYIEVKTNGGWFWLSNECSDTKMIDP